MIDLQPTTKTTKSSRIGLGKSKNLLQLVTNAYWLARKAIVYCYLGILLVINIVVNLKSYLVRRMFWGRGSLYKTSFHFTIFAVTSMLLLTNLVSYFSAFAATTEDSQDAELFVYSSGGNMDILQQGTAIKSATASTAGIATLKVYNYVVQEGDSLQSIADSYSVSVDTVRSSNAHILMPFDDRVAVGTELEIPEMNGVLYTVLPGDGLAGVLDKMQGADQSSVISLNSLTGPDYVIYPGQKIFIPNAKLKLYGTFGNPLSQCPGYKYGRGLTSYHNGVDLIKGGGCPIVAAAPGIVIAADNKDALSGYRVIIDHGGGIVTKYFHGQPGTFGVSVGEQVQMGQYLMQMGCTGRCFGTHLHFELMRDGRYLNPLQYVPFF